MLDLPKSCPEEFDHDMTHGTIPSLFDSAVARAPDQEWLLYEDQRYTFARAAARVASCAAALSELGIVRGSLVMATAPNHPATLFCWLATVRLGAVFCPVNPRSTATELAGLVAQARPDLLVTGSAERDLVDSADLPPVTRVAIDALSNGPDLDPIGMPSAARPDDPAVLIPTSGTTGRSKLVTQTHRAYAMAGEGFPFWLQLTADDRLMTSLPLFHINAPAYSRSRVGRRRREPGAAAPVLRQHVHGLGPGVRRDRVQRDRGDARDADEPAGACRRRRQPAAPVLHRPVADPRAAA